MSSNFQDTGANTVLESANSIFVSDKLDIVDDYARILRESYRAGIRPTDFSKPQQAANDVNTWVSNATHGLIPDIVTPGKSLVCLKRSCSSLLDGIIEDVRIINYHVENSFKIL